MVTQALPPVVLAVLEQLEVLTSEERNTLDYRQRRLTNHREILLVK